MPSIYIPRISKAFNEDCVKAIFMNLRIGEVSRVDFVDCDFDPQFRKAFVHLSFYYVTQIANDMRTAHEKCIAFNIRPEYWDPTSNVYWMTLMNRNPVPETSLNIHQLAENLRILEGTVATNKAECLNNNSARFIAIEENQTKIEKRMEDLRDNVRLGDSFVAIKLSNMEKAIDSQKELIKRHIVRQDDQINRLQQSFIQLMGSLEFKERTIEMYKAIILNVPAAEIEGYTTEEVCLFNAFHKENPDFYCDEDCGDENCGDENCGDENCGDEYWLQETQTVNYRDCDGGKDCCGHDYCEKCDGDDDSMPSLIQYEMDFENAD
jgi:hypothetical protein